MAAMILRLEGELLEEMRDVTLTLLSLDTGACIVEFDVIKRAHVKHGELWREIINQYDLDDETQYIFDHVTGHIYEEAL